MPIQSKVNDRCYFDYDSWLVSVLNTSDKVKGHSMIVVEGIQKGNPVFKSTLFVQQYDIQATLYSDQDSSINKKGKIMEVRIFSGYGRDFSKYPSRSYNANPAKVKEMIKSILIDHETCIKGKEGKCEYPHYQMVGEGHFLSDIGMGDNCASWSIKKLAIAGIGDGTGKPKPQKVAQAPLTAKL